MLVNLEAAASVLGSILIDPSCLDTVRAEITPDMLPFDYQRDIYNAACSLADEKRPVDPLTVGNRVQERGGTFDKKYFLDLMEVTPTSANVLEYCKLLRRDAMSRTLEALTRRASDELTAGQDPFLVAQDLTANIETLSKLENASGAVSGSDAMVELFQAMEEAERRAPCLQTGYNRLDSVLGGGLMLGCLYILAARPGQGKTTLGASIAEHVAARGHKVLFVSLEMTRQQLSARRVAAYVGTVSAAQVLTGNCHGKDLDAVTAAMSALSTRPILFNRRGKLNVREIRFLAQKNKAELVVIDYLGLVKHGDGKSLYERVTETSGSLKEMTVDLNIPVLCLAQLNREVEGRGGKPPQLSDLRDSGAIEQDADAVLMLHRLQPIGEGTPGLEPLDLYVRKNRYGPLATISLSWSLKNGRIVAGS